ncbi:unnamed protein product [Orchesella dallaii]|uniref:F-box domain-containing protein n=1 Tax=Orchesella dallaii TaxID=48710 RepID=A0ABP1R218_9HEXA
MGAHGSKDRHPPSSISNPIVKQLKVNRLPVQHDHPHQAQLSLHLWQNIVKYLEPQDFTSFMNTCPQYRDKLCRLAPPVLFPKILGILMDNGFLGENPRSPILSHRLVNSQVKNSVDAFLNNNPHPPSWLQDAYTFRNSERIETFIQNYNAEKVENCSFLFTTIQIEAKSADCFNSALTLFLGYGQYLTKVYMELEFQPCPEIVMRQLNLALSQLPNISALHVSAEVEPRREPPYNPLPRQFTPQLERLKELSFYFNSKNNEENMRLPSSISSLTPLYQSFLQSYGRKLKHFAVSHRFLQEAGITAAHFSTLLPELRELRILFRDKDERKETELFDLLGQIQLQDLEELRLDNYYEGEGEGILFSEESVRALQNFRGSLKSLRIGKMDAKCVCGINPANTNVFPRLKKLVLCTENLEGSMWFLFRGMFTELEELRFKMGGEQLREDPVPLEYLRGFFGVFPKLKKVIWMRGRGIGMREVVIRR